MTTLPAPESTRNMANSERGPASPAVPPVPNPRIPSSIIATASSNLRSELGARLSVLIAGEAGTGKSSLINALFGARLAEVGIGDGVTSGFHCYENDLVAIIDSQGFERAGDGFNGSKLVEVVKNPSALGVSSISHVDLVWYFVNSRIHQEDRETWKRLQSLKIPVVVIISKADKLTPEEISVLIASIGSKFNGYDRKYFAVHTSYNPPVAKCVLCKSDCFQREESVSSPDSGEPAMVHLFCSDVKCFYHTTHISITQGMSTERSLRVLMRKCESLLQGAQLRRFQIAQQVDIEGKWKYTIAPISIAVASALAVGASPIPFSDFPLLLAIQLAMVIAIASIYSVGVGISHSSLLALLFAFLFSGEIAGLFAAIGLGLGSTLKCIPGMGTVAGAVIEGSVAAVITLALGVVVVIESSVLAKLRVKYGETEGEPRRLEISQRFRRNFGNVSRELWKKYSSGTTNLKSAVPNVVEEYAKKYSEEVNSENSAQEASLSGEVKIQRSGKDLDQSDSESISTAADMFAPSDDEQQEVHPSGGKVADYNEWEKALTEPNENVVIFDKKFSDISEAELKAVSEPDYEIISTVDDDADKREDGVSGKK